jgi:hypothetical protein
VFVDEAGGPIGSIQVFWSPNSDLVMISGSQLTSDGSFNVWTVGTPGGQSVTSGDLGFGWEAWRMGADWQLGYSADCIGDWIDFPLPGVKATLNMIDCMKNKPGFWPTNP